MEGKLRNMTSVYITKDDKMLLLFRQGGRVVNDVWTGSAGGHFEECELNDARACILRQMSISYPMKVSPDGLRIPNFRIWKCHTVLSL